MKINQQELEAYILGQGPHTYRGICKHFNEGSVLAGSVRVGREMQIDRTLQKLRRAGKISFARDKQDIIWSAVVDNHGFAD